MLAGLLLGNGAVYLFNRLPAEWLCDYGEEPTDEMKDPYTQRIKSYPWKYVFSMLFTAVGLYLVRDDIVYTVAVLAVLFLMTELAISDGLYRIVPDQLLILLLVSAVGFLQYHPDYFDMIYGAGAGLGIMGITALAGKLMYRREAIGWGDIKLFGALGLITGLYGVISIFILTSLISGAHLVFLLFTKRIKRTDTVPMVPYIAVATGIYFVFLHTYIDLLTLKI